MTMRRVIVLCLLLSGCGFLKRNPNTFYSLEVIKPASSPAAPSGPAAAPLAVDGVELPPGLDRRELVVRGTDNKLEVRGTQLWAAPLEDMVIHTLAFDLANRLPEGSVVLPGQTRPSAVRPISITFEELAATAGNAFVLDARWTEGGVSHHERIAVSMTSSDSAAIARAMSEALAQLADRMAAAR